MFRYSHPNPDPHQPYRLRNDRTGREVVPAAQPDLTYVDREIGGPLKVIGKLLPLTPSPPRLPWSVENLRVCPTRDELVQKDLNYCLYDGRRLPPLDPLARADAAHLPDPERD
jgi:hypothetical protein